ncbi:hypothetical protein WA026_003893 [Henosepilachna vigintioctopunctata]|uniref:Uncharacterized protein n=1 Tax=Henosepilachna vigintioctopunctata TaxID=420089 RepID=A0AAW1U849_9CUCU
MCRLPFYLLVLCCVIILPAIKGLLPPFIKVCNFTSPDFAKCAVESGKAALPSILKGNRELDIPPFHPLKIPLVEFSSGSFRLNATDVVMDGYHNFNITDVKFDKEQQFLEIDSTSPLFELNFHINIDGKLGSLRIEGNGPTVIKLYNGTFAYKFNYKTHKENGKTFASYEKDEFVAKPAHVYIHIDNLFSGNKLLGDNMNKFLNENWPDILEELRPVVSEMVGSVTRRMLVNLFKETPLEDMFIGY